MVVYNPAQKAFFDLLGALLFYGGVEYWWISVPSIAFMACWVMSRK